MPQIDEAIEALLAYQQADMEGVMVLTSRQAIHEVADELRRMRTLAQGCVKTEPDAWLVQWFRANGDAGTNVYVKESDARNAAKNLEIYSSSETTAGIVPLYAAPSSDGCGEVGLSPALASEGHQRPLEHGVMPVGPMTETKSGPGASPSDPQCSAGTESAADTEMYRLRDLIASHIACQEDCQKMPTGCGCALTAARAVMNGGPQRPVWQPIETAPKDRTILLYGPQVGGSEGDLAGWDGNIVASGYYDGIDTSWCVTGSTWRGPFIGATHWRELPEAPASTVSRPQSARGE